MSKRSARSALLATTLLLAACAYLYVKIPRLIGEISIHSIELVPSETTRRLIGADLGSEASKILKVELLSDTELVAKTLSTSGVSDLYAGGSACPFNDSARGTWSMTRGPFPDDQPQFTPTYVSRRSPRRSDGLYRYTIYVSASDLIDFENDICIKLKGTSFFSPHVESRIITIPYKLIARAARAKP